MLTKVFILSPSKRYGFEEINKERDAQEELDYVEAALEAQVIAKNLEFENLVSVARVLLGSQAEKMSSIELKRDILLYAKENPVDFLDTLNDPMLEMQDTVYQFFNKNYLTF